MCLARILGRRGPSSLRYAVTSRRPSSSFLVLGSAPFQMEGHGPPWPLWIRAVRPLRLTLPSNSIIQHSAFIIPRFPYPFTAPVVIPLTNCFWKTMNAMTSGKVIRKQPAMSMP